MAYPRGALQAARNLQIDPALHNGLLNGMVNAEQAFQAVDRLSGIGHVVQINMLLDLPAAAPAPVGTWTLAEDANFLHNAYFTNETADANNDEFSIRFHLPSSGTWRFDLLAGLDADCPIIKFYIGAQQIGVVAGYDLYAAGPDELNAIAIAGLALTAGSHVLRLLVDGRNGLSGGWAVRIAKMLFRRTA